MIASRPFADNFSIRAPARGALPAMWVRAFDQSYTIPSRFRVQAGGC